MSKQSDAAALISARAANLTTTGPVPLEGRRSMSKQSDAEKPRTAFGFVPLCPRGRAILDAVDTWRRARAAFGADADEALLARLREIEEGAEDARQNN